MLQVSTLDRQKQKLHSAAETETENTETRLQRLQTEESVSKLQDVA